MAGRARVHRTQGQRDRRRRRAKVLCKILCHNITCLIQEQETLGIVPVFWKDEAERIAILPMVRA
jgi:hypothetical protein